MTKATAESWIELGFKTLIEEGSDGLAAEKLSKKQGVTRGSFYHRFNSRQGYVESLLDEWLNLCQQQIESSHGSTSQDNSQFSALHSFAWALPHELDVAIRSWSLRDPTVKTYQSKADKMRLSHLVSLFRLSVDSPMKANRLAQVAYVSLVGAQHLTASVKSLSFEQFKSALDSTLTDSVNADN